MLKKHSIAIYRNGSNKFDGILGVIFNLILYLYEKENLRFQNPAIVELTPPKTKYCNSTFMETTHSPLVPEKDKFTCVHVY